MSTDSISRSQTRLSQKISSSTPSKAAANAAASSSTRFLFLLIIVGILATGVAIAGIISQNYWVAVFAGLVAAASIYTLALRYSLS